MMGHSNDPRDSPMPDIDMIVPSSPTHSQKSTFGPQVLSHRLTGPFTLFGTSDRVNMEKIYIDKELNKLIPGNNSPGPIYNSLSSIGKQVESINGNAPCLTFGRDKRWKGRRSTGVPGPGAYEDKVTAFGNQCVSSKQSPEKTDFGKATREQTYKIEEKARFISPGPVRCDERSSIGSQIHSANSTAPKFRFGHERRFRVRLLGSKNKERRWEWGRMQTQVINKLSLCVFFFRRGLFQKVRLLELDAMIASVR
ncbi:uncharacterized protein LOC9663165 [Selaginella moellendorffii]|uniref:uncharacterized protein LOC9663165 n=1 Tax=Selaginella moellendorffii TaxID=88036 RepID=UPI000D1C950C|nr:uncharacterized protein LOC9663165 [Selaginella moellendorffii]|eukprot:XP_024527854.1 uncharacterized protein LOC9663165 [Selaginella moellendorffii]